MQLVAYGAQDIYLTGNPQITFFKVVYRRHTNFSMETIRQTLNGTSTSVITGNATCTISRNGDLVHKVYVVADSSTANNGSALVYEVELEIGGQRIDRHYQEWNEVWNELSTDESKALALKSMQCEVGTGGSGAVETVQIPLNFWFCRNPGLALPLIALQYHEVKIKFTWGNAGASLNPEVWCDYIYLDTDERRRFAQVSHEYLIEQLQKETYTSTAGDKKLNFNHPVKELVWVNDTGGAEGVKYQLKLNGHDRFAEQTKEYFMLRQPFDHHTAVPKQNLPVSAQIGLSNNTISNLTALSDGAEMTPKDAAGASSNEITVAGGTALKVETAVFDDISVGDTLVLVISALDASNDAFLPTASRAVGDVFFAGVSAKSGTQDITLSTKFTKLGSANTQLDTIDVGTGGQGRCFLHKVSNTSQSEARTSKLSKEINVYSFALKPEEHQPSGTCNFSRIDNAQLKVTGSDGGGRIYAVNYNVLRIMSGMGGLAYSN